MDIALKARADFSLGERLNALTSAVLCPIDLVIPATNEVVVMSGSVTIDDPDVLIDARGDDVRRILAPLLHEGKSLGRFGELAAVIIQSHEVHKDILETGIAAYK
jgi:hypothetical protein